MFSLFGLWVGNKSTFLKWRFFINVSIDVFRTWYSAFKYFMNCPVTNMQIVNAVSNVCMWNCSPTLMFIRRGMLLSNCFVRSSEYCSHRLGVILAFIFENGR